MTQCEACAIWETCFPDKTECFQRGSTSANTEGKNFSIDKISYRQNYCRIKIDDCLIKSNENKKCDYLFFECEREIFVFVEFKGGKKITDAYEQICNAIDFLEPLLRKQNI